jgi:hypothetical protein
MELYDKLNATEYGREHVFKLVEADLTELILAAETEEEFKQWIEAFKVAKEIG